MDALPLVLLGIQTTVKEDLSATVAEMVYGTTLWLPGEFFQVSDSNSIIDPTDYVSQQKRTCNVFTQPLLAQYKETLMYLRHWLQLHVFVRHDTTRKPLQPQYDGPYLVLDKKNKIFRLDINGHKDSVY